MHAQREIRTHDPSSIMSASGDALVKGDMDRMNCMFTVTE